MMVLPTHLVSPKYFRTYLVLSSKKNYKITIVSFEKSKNYLQNKDVILNKLEKNKVEWIPLKYTKYPPIFSTLLDIYKLNQICKQT